MKQLSPTDSVFVFNEAPTTPLHISPLLIYDPPAKGEDPVRFKDILERFAQRLHKSPVFRRKLSRVPLDLDRPYWVEDEAFDLEYHVRHNALPKPGDWRQFCIMLARLHNRPLDLRRPPWEAYVIEGLDNINGIPSGSFALYMKIHHSAIDGATGGQMIEALHDLVANPEPDDVHDDWQPEREPSSAQKLGLAYRNLFSKPNQIQAILSHAIKSRSALIKEIVNEGVPDHGIHERTRFNQAVSAHRVLGGVRMDLAELKFIKNTVGQCTLNDVLLSIVGGTLRMYLKDKRELPSSSLVVGVPISTRNASNINTEGGNEVAGMRLNLRTDIASPLKRLQAINQDAISSKAYASAIGVERMTTMINSLPSGLTSLGMRVMATTGLAARTPMAHTIVTNVPGPQHPMYFCGAKASAWIGLGCLLDGMGLFHTINSYNGNVFLSFLACREMMPDPDLYHHFINRSIQEHLVAAQAQAKTRARVKPKPKVKTNSKRRSAAVMAAKGKKTRRKIPASANLKDT